MDNPTASSPDRDEVVSRPPGWRIDGIPVWQFALRSLWVSILLYAVFCLGERGIVFLYQGY
jgi:hypothetical protein